MWLERERSCRFISTHVFNYVWTTKCVVLGLILWERLNLKDNRCVFVMCDVFSPSVDWRRLYSVFYPHTFITVFYRCCQPFSAPRSPSCVCARKMGRRDMRRRCTSPCTLMSLHTAACVLALIQYCKTNNDAALFEIGGSLRSSVSKLWEGILSRGEPWIFFVGPECFLIPPEAAFPACVWAIESLPVCVLGACGNQLLTYYKWAAALSSIPPFMLMWTSL